MIIKTIVTWRHDIDNLIIRDVPVSSTIVEMDNELIIIDTGMAENDQLAAELEESGYSPADFTMVINTHLHCDHVGGNRLFNKARILISRRELEFETEFAQTMQSTNDPLAILQAMGRDIDEDSAARAWEIKELQQNYPVKSLVGNSAQLEFFEDEPLLPGNLSLMRVPGHSIDSRAIILKGQDKQAAVTGDAFYHRDLWKVCVLGINYDNNLFQKNAERLSHFKGIIIPGHDHPFDNYSGKYLTEDSLKL